MSCFIGFLLGITRFYWVLPGFTGFYWVLLGCTGLYLVTSALLANRQLTDGKVAAHRQGEPVGKTKQVGGKLKTKRRSPQKVQKKKRDKTPKGKENLKKNTAETTPLNCRPPTGSSFLILNF